MKILFLTVALLCFTFAFADEHGDAAKDMSPMGGKADDHSDDDGHTHDGEEADHSHDDDDNDDDHDDDKDEGYGEGSRGGDDERTKIMEFMKDLMGKMPKGGDDDGKKMMEFMGKLLGLVGKGRDHEDGEDGGYGDGEDGGYGEGEDGGYSDGKDGGYGDGDDGGYGDGDDGGYGDGDDSGYGDGDDSGYGDFGKGGKKSDVDALMKIITEVLDQLLPGGKGGYDSKGIMQTGGKKSDVDAVMEIINKVLDRLLPGGQSKQGGYGGKGKLGFGGMEWNPRKSAQTVTEITLGVLDGLLPGWQSKIGKGSYGAGGYGSQAAGHYGGVQWNPAKTAQGVTEMTLGVLEGLFPGWRSKIGKGSYGAGAYGSKAYGQYGGVQWNPAKKAQGVTEMTLGVLEGLFPGWRSKLGKGSYGAGGYGSKAAGQYGGVQWNPAKKAQGVTEMTLGVLEGLFPGWQGKMGKGSYGAGGYGSKAAGQYGGVQWNPAKKAQGVTEMTLGVLEGLFPGWQGKMGKGSYGAGGYGSKAAGQYGGFQWDPKRNAEKVTELTLGVLEGLAPGWQSKYGSKTARRGGMGGYDYSSMGEKGGFEDWMKGRGWGKGGYSGKGDFSEIMSSVMKMFMGGNGGEWPKW
uniref:glycine-rich cell wall structural protein 1.8-like isoform X3 n=1 Tax=Styela clava TaxID=7725 RepID=UPI00193AB17D|nr:glycine-rich cell wall structural protein 1.8-like isoform X3 [Styela clava]